MKIIEAEAAKFDNTKIYVHRRSRKEGRRVDGRYLRIGGIFRLGTPNLPRTQYIGMTNHLILTMNYPVFVNDLLGLAADLPCIGTPTNTITWVSPVTANIQKGALWYFFPRRLWDFVEGDYSKIIQTSSYVSVVTGYGRAHYYILNVPLITRKFLRSRYSEISLKRSKKNEYSTNTSIC